MITCSPSNNITGPWRTPTALHVRVVTGRGSRPEKTIMQSPRFIDARRYRLAAAYMHPVGDDGVESLATEANEAGMPFFTIGERGPADPRTLRSLFNICREQRVELFHAHDYKSNLLGLMLRRLWPMRLVTTVHGWTHNTTRARLYYHLDNRCLRQYDHVITVSPQLARHCRELGVDDDKITYIPNAIDVRNVRMLAASSGSHGGSAIGMVGRLSTEKGVDRAIAMIARLRHVRPDVELHLIGDGPQRQALHETAVRLDVNNRVHFHGWSKRPIETLRLVDLLLSTSLTEGMPNSLLEAMAAGVPVAATDVGGVGEMLADGSCGLMLDDDESQWAGQIAALLGDADQRRRYARLARQRVEHQYDFATRMQRVTGVYDHLLAASATPQRRAA